MVTFSTADNDSDSPIGNGCKKAFQTIFEPNIQSLKNCKNNLTVQKLYMLIYILGEEAILSKKSLLWMELRTDRQPDFPFRCSEKMKRKTYLVKYEATEEGG